MAEASEFLSLAEAAKRLRMTTKTLALFLRQNPQHPPLFARPGRDYLISRDDFARIYEAMKICKGGRPAKMVVLAPLSERQAFERLKKHLARQPKMKR